MKPTMRILPLKGKYYETQIKVIDGPCAGMVFKLWHSTGNPSEREGISADELEDEHYESQETYELAKQIVGEPPAPQKTPLLQGEKTVLLAKAVSQWTDTVTWLLLSSRITTLIPAHMRATLNYEWKRIRDIMNEILEDIK